MADTEKLFHDIAASLTDCTEGKMFGALSIKAANGKAGVLFKKGIMAFKLEGKAADEAMALKGSKTFEPAPGKAMNGWIQVSEEHSGKWKGLAKKAMKYVASLEK